MAELKSSPARQWNLGGRGGIATWHRSALVSIKEVRAAASASRGDPFQVVRFHLLLPLTGWFEWREGSRSHTASSQHALYVPGEREYRVFHSQTGEHSLVLVPSQSRLEELEALGRFSASQSDIRLGRPQTILLAHRLLWQSQQGAEPMEIDELFCELILSMAGAPGLTNVAPASLAVVRRAKEFLHENLSAHIGLADVAQVAGVSPIYLTNLFKRVEGVPLHQYLLRLRLAESLRRLPDASDLTGLAYDVGFSSHSHFSAAFRSRFGLSPRQARLEAIPTGGETGSFQLLPMCSARGGEPDAPAERELLT